MDTSSIVHKVNTYFVSSVDMGTRSKPRIFCYPPLLNDIIIGFFYKMEKDGSCGEGMVLSWR